MGIFKFNRIEIKNMIKNAFIPAVLLAAFSVMAYAETYTLETYYPSPVGAYYNLVVTSDTVLARDGGSVGIGTSVPAAGVALGVNGFVSVASTTVLASNGGSSVGIGTNVPAAGLTLDIHGLMAVSRLNVDPTPLPCVSGAIYYNSIQKKIRGCEDGAWKNFLQ